MKVFTTQDGTNILVPDDESAITDAITAAPAKPQYRCDCYDRMGNEFWFLPTGSCLRDDKTCNAKVPL